MNRKVCYNAGMTVCIGALADNGASAVIASDKMITANIPMPYEYEGEVQKINAVGADSYVLIAGNVLYASEMIEQAKTIASDVLVEQVSEIMRNAFVLKRRQVILQRVLEPRGMTLESYYQFQTQLVIGVVQEIENNLLNFDIGVQIIVAGKGADGKFHLYSISHPGELVCHDSIGFVCTGIGAPYAMYHFIGDGYKKSKSLVEVEKIVRDAKKKSEVAPGVGTETELKKMQVGE